MYNQIDSNKRKTAILIIIFVALILFLGWFFGQLYEYGYFGLVIAIIISLVMTLTSYYKGDKVALWTAGAKEIKKGITAGLPLPKVHIINDSTINAFATGRDPKHASIAITQGAIDKLENEELEGVIAHELSHIKNYDIRLMTIVIVLVGIIALFADFMFRAQIYGGRRSRSSGQGSGWLMIIGIALMILAPLIAQLIKLAISRKREFLADASGSLLTRYPEGLAKALEKIKMDNLPVQKASNATAHLYIANPFRGKKKFLAKAFSTHPPIEERIAALRAMA